MDAFNYTYNALGRNVNAGGNEGPETKKLGAPVLYKLEAKRGGKTLLLFRRQSISKTRYGPGNNETNLGSSNHILLPERAYLRKPQYSPENKGDCLQSCIIVNSPSWVRVPDTLPITGPLDGEVSAKIPAEDSPNQEG